MRRPCLESSSMGTCTGAKNLTASRHERAAPTNPDRSTSVKTKYGAQLSGYHSILSTVANLVARHFTKFDGCRNLIAFEYSKAHY
jgi:hypothetical protein